MTAKEYLSRLYYLESKISEDKRRVERLKEQAEKRTSEINQVMFPLIECRVAEARRSKLTRCASG